MTKLIVVCLWISLGLSKGYVGVSASSQPTTYFATSTQVQVASPHEGDLFLLGNAGTYQVRLTRNEQVYLPNPRETMGSYYFKLDSRLVAGESLLLSIYDRNDVYIESLDLVVGEALETGEVDQPIQLEQELIEGQVVISGYAQPNRLIALEGLENQSDYLVVDASGYFYHELEVPLEKGTGVRLMTVDLKGQVGEGIVVNSVLDNPNRPNQVKVESFDLSSGRLTGYASPNAHISLAYWRDAHREYAQIQADSQGFFIYQLDITSLSRNQLEISEMVYQSNVSIISSPILYYMLPS